VQAQHPKSPDPEVQLTDIESRIRDYVADNLLFSGNGFMYADDASFLNEGIVDSVGVLELILFVQEAFSVNVDDAEVTPDNFDSVANLAAYIRRKLALVGQG
jgi:acyl carrier protein